jgi:hypothetical protein
MTKLSILPRLERVEKRAGGTLRAQRQGTLAVNFVITSRFSRALQVSGKVLENPLLFKK